MSLGSESGRYTTDWTQTCSTPSGFFSNGAAGVWEYVLMDEEGVLSWSRSFLSLVPSRSPAERREVRGHDKDDTTSKTST